MAEDLQHGMDRTVRFEIEYTSTCPGVDVSLLSVFPGEKEVLFPPCTGLSLSAAEAGVTADGGGRGSFPRAGHAGAGTIMHDER